ncbi:MAG: tRNA (adenosine(37)-N6)-threonylcarbamoyltransferase complex ATPase subunit type 1 TsaE [Ruminococcaceae bacterium]|nr:tRNA (adenosine(37)-N6)-threonylcarbamoyltransferase complex ATPase subunit type 1 TsaE [Oscillospiraceae bacterium]
MEVITVFNSQSVTDTESFGAKLASAMLTDSSLPKFIALYGDLGVGKTAFVRGFTSQISPSSRVKSPTFALVNEYKGSLISVFHFDMYRIENEDELYSIGFYDYLQRKGICLVEWSENIEESLPDEYLKVEIVKDSTENTDSRKITVSKY